MASYLLKTDDVTMARWKAEASDRGYSFAEFLRACVEAELSVKPRPTPVEEVRPSPPIVVPRPIPPGTTIMPSGKKSYTPDFKGKLKKPRDM